MLKEVPIVSLILITFFPCLNILVIPDWVNKVDMGGTGSDSSTPFYLNWWVKNSRWYIIPSSKGSYFKSDVV